MEKLRPMKLKEAAKKVENGIEKTLTYCDFPSEHWPRIRINNCLERLNREFRRTRMVGGVSRWRRRPHVTVTGCAMWPAPSGANEHEAPGGCP